MIGGSVKYIPYQASVIFTSYCHHPAVLGDLLMAYSLYTDVNDFFEITEGLPLLKKKEADYSTSLYSGMGTKSYNSAMQIASKTQTGKTLGLPVCVQSRFPWIVNIAIGARRKSYNRKYFPHNEITKQRMKQGQADSS